MYAILLKNKIFRITNAQRFDFLTEDNEPVSVSPVEVGWEGFGYKVVPYHPAEVKPGQHIVSAEDKLVKGEVYQMATYEDDEWPGLTNKQFWKVLALAGLHAGIMAFVDNLPLEDQIEAKQSAEYRPDHWLISENRASFGLNDEQFKTIWFWATTL